MKRHDDERDTSGLPFYRTLCFIGATLLVYVGFLAVSERLSPDYSSLASVILPNAWLLASSLLFLGSYLVGLRALGSHRPRTWVVSFILILAAFVCGIGRENEAMTFFAEAGLGGDAIVPLFVVVLVPLAEELFFRGALLAFFSRHFGKVPAVIMVSLLFGILHVRSDMVVTMMLFSIALCITVLLSGNLIWAIVIHVAWNAFSAMNDWAGPDAWMYLFVAAVATVAAVLLVGSIGRAKSGSR